ncbi:MAG: MarR family winged helix-turn-helix transcriptional regulator [Actinomycetes bacterium]
MSTTTTTEAPASHDLGPALQALGRALVALKASPQSFGLDSRVDRAAYLILARISDAGTTRMSDLATLLSLDLSTVSRQVRALEEQGLVGRTSDPGDRRAYFLEPTETGRALVTQVKEKFSALVDLALAEWSERDRRTLTSLLTRLAGDLRPDRAPSLVAAVREQGTRR